MTLKHVKNSSEEIAEQDTDAPRHKQLYQVYPLFSMLQ